MWCVCGRSCVSKWCVCGRSGVSVWSVWQVSGQFVVCVAGQGSACGVCVLHLWVTAAAAVGEGL